MNDKASTSKEAGPLIFSEEFLVKNLRKPRIETILADENLSRNPIDHSFHRRNIC